VKAARRLAVRVSAINARSLPASVLMRH